MAKERKIKREEVVAENAAMETSSAVKSTAEVKPVESCSVEPLKVDVQLLTSRASIMSIRVVGDIVLFNDGLHMTRLPIVKGKPITITMRQ